MFLTSWVATISLATIIAAPSLQVHFGLEYLLVYYVPVVAFGAASLVEHLRTADTLLLRIRSAMPFLFIWGAALFAFAVGALQEMEVMQFIAMNCVLGMAVVLYPWEQSDLRRFMLAIAVLSLTVAGNTAINLSSDAALKLATEEQKDGYLASSLFMAFGCLAALFLVVDRFSPLTLSLLIVNWFGLALGRGRGAVIFCALITLLYLIMVMRARIPSFGVGKKIILLTALAISGPYVLAKLTTFAVSEGRWSRIFDVEAEVVQGGRGAIMMDAVEKIGQSWVYGNGLGASLEGDTYPHNLFLQYMVDGGAVSGLLLLIFLSVVFWRGYRAFRLADPRFVNATMAATALFALAFANLLKSGNAYIVREFFVLAALPLVVYRMATLRHLVQRRSFVLARRQRAAALREQ